MSDDKIRFYKEVLTIEPASKVFYPLGRLLFQDDRKEEAVEILTNGLAHRPDHLEARLLLVEALDAMGRESKALNEVDEVIRILSQYPAFWRLWAGKAGQDSKDMALALNFLASYFKGASISWADLIQVAFEVLSGKDADLPTPAAPQTSQPSSPPEPAPELRTESRTAAPASGVRTSASLRTRTMAELLAAQGDVRGALEIYQELLGGTSSEQARQELERLVEGLRSRLGENGNSVAGQDEHGRNGLLEFLQRLAGRFEEISAT